MNGSISYEYATQHLAIGELNELIRIANQIGAEQRRANGV
jgi:hypothetical protein